MKLWPLLSLLLCSCQATAQTRHTSKNTNRASISFNIDGKDYTGIAEVERKIVHTIKFFIPDDTIKFMITTCNREEIPLKFKDNKYYIYNYIPLRGVEDTGSCFLTATTITDAGVTDKAIIDFFNNLDIQATMGCNGVQSVVKGAAICQSRQGLLQILSFTEDVIIVTQDGCPLPIADKSNYQFMTSKGFCSYLITNKAKQQFRFLTYGYTAVNELLE